MTILPALSMRCSSVVKGGPGSCKSALQHVARSSLQHHQRLNRLALIPSSDEGLTIWMITAFPQLHDDIKQPRLSLLFTRGTC